MRPFGAAAREDDLGLPALLDGRGRLWTMSLKAPWVVFGGVGVSLFFSFFDEKRVMLSENKDDKRHCFRVRRTRESTRKEC